MASVRYVGHATALVDLDGASVLTDPFLRNHIGPLRRHGARPDRGATEAPDAIVVSHPHRDHLDLPSLRIPPAGIPTIVPRGAGSLAARAGRTEVIELAPGEAVTVRGAEIAATEAVHDGRRDPWSESLTPLGFVLSRAGKRVYFAGDTDLFDGMAALRPLDAALIPVWGWGPTLGTGHLDPERAARTLELLRPRLAIPIHWGALFPAGLSRIKGDRLTEPPLVLQRAASKGAPEVEVRVLRPGETTPVP